QEEATSLRAQIKQTASGLASRMGQAQDTVSWLVRYWQTARLNQSLESAEKKIQQAAQALAEANAQRRQIAIEVEALLTLRREQWTAYRLEAAREQQEHLDELGLRRWQAAQTAETSPQDTEGA